MDKATNIAFNRSTSLSQCSSKTPHTYMAIGRTTA